MNPLSGNSSNLVMANSAKECLPSHGSLGSNQTTGQTSYLSSPRTKRPHHADQPNNPETGKIQKLNYMGKFKSSKKQLDVTGTSSTAQDDDPTSEPTETVDPYGSMFNNNNALGLIKEGSYHEAENTLNEIIARGEGDQGTADIYLTVAVYHSGGGNYSAALSCYESALEIYRKFPDCLDKARSTLESIADLHTKACKFVEAAEKYVEIINSFDSIINEKCGRLIRDLYSLYDKQSESSNQKQKDLAKSMSNTITTYSGESSCKDISWFLQEEKREFSETHSASTEQLSNLYKISTLFSIVVSKFNQDTSELLNNSVGQPPREMSTNSRFEALKRQQQLTIQSLPYFVDLTKEDPRSSSGSAGGTSGKPVIKP